MPRYYYSQRKNKNGSKISFGILKDLVINIFDDFRRRGYFDQYFGYDCIDQGTVPGLSGEDIASFVLRKTKNHALWPIEDNRKSWRVDDLFDFIEFTFDCISKPLPQDAYYHQFGDCGWHYKFFNKQDGQLEYKQEMCDVLSDYASGYALSVSGEIISLPEAGLDNLINKASLPENTPTTLVEKIEHAKNKFLRYNSSILERQEAVRALADCFEILKPKLVKVLTSNDEKDLFNIANNFSIRHLNNKQKDKYDKNIWLSWMFYFYLATLHASLRLINERIKKYNVLCPSQKST